MSRPTTAHSPAVTSGSYWPRRRAPETQDAGCAPSRRRWGEALRQGRLNRPGAAPSGCLVDQAVPRAPSVCCTFVSFWFFHHGRARAPSTARPRRPSGTHQLSGPPGAATRPETCSVPGTAVDLTPLPLRPSPSSPRRDEKCRNHQPLHLPKGSPIMSTPSPTRCHLEAEGFVGGDDQ